MDLEFVAYEKTESVATITLNRPSRLNALVHQMIREIHAAVNDIEKDDAIRVVVLRGAGRAFCSGDDMRDMVDTLRPLPRQGDADFRPEGYHSLVIALRELRKPVIACVHGYALGAGFEIALACDFVIAREDARFGAVLITRGMVGGTYLLPRLVGLSRAAELVLLGETFDAQTARSLGLIYRVVPAETLEEEVAALTRRLADAPTAAIGLAKVAMNRGLTMSLREGMEYQGLALALSLMTEDFQEGVTAFNEKRPARFSGK
jgi:enoyl-CoA hydratase/carnithine racemase